MNEKNNLLIMSHQSSSESDDNIPSNPLDSKSDHSSKDTNFEKKQDDPFLLKPQKAQNHDDIDKDINFEKEQDDPFLLKPQKAQNHDDIDKDITKKSSFVCNKEKMALKDEEKELTSVDDYDVLEEESEREKLKRHRVEVAGRVWIPEKWGQEELLKDWIDCTAFDAPLVPSRITLARDALVEEGTTTNATPLRIDNRC